MALPRSVRPGAAAWTALALGLVASVLAARLAREVAGQREEARMHQAVVRVQTSLTARFEGFEDTLRSAAGLFVASEDVTEAEFRRYWDELGFLSRNPSVLSLSYLVPVRRADLPTYLERRRAAGSELKVAAGAETPEDLYLVQYREGRQASDEGVGFDAGTDARFRAALDAARDSAASRVVIPVSPREHAPGPAFAVVYPIYRNRTMSVSTDERRQQLLGWVSMVVAVNPLMAAAVSVEEPGLAISLLEGAGEPAPVLLYEAPGAEPGPGARHVRSTLVLGGCRFTTVFVARPEFVDGPSRRVPPGILVSGLLVTGLLFGILWSISATRSRADALAGAMTTSLRDSEQRYEQLFEQSLAGIFRTRPDGRILECNEAFARLFGYDSRQELLDQSAFSFYENPEARARFLLELRRNGTLVAYESRSRRKDGTLFWTLEHATLVPGSEETIEGTVIDITMRKEAEEGLRQSRERYRSVIETSRDGLMFFDLATRRILETNPALQRMLGYTAEEFSTRSFYDIGPEDRASIDENVHQLVEARSISLAERKYRAKGGREIAVAVDAVLVEEDRRQLVLAIIHNLSETRHLEAQLQQAQKMEAIGRLAGGVAHDFNNLLTAILGYADLLLDTEASEDVHKCAEEIRKAGDRAASLTKQLLAFSRKQVLQPRILDLNEILAETDGMLRRLVGEDVKLETEREPHLWRVQADPVQIQQVLMNLVVNARDAMPDGGRVRIATRNVSLTADHVPDAPVVLEGDHVLLEVSDSGHGMNAEVLNRAFEPFFTTKERGKGTGLGLATVYGIVKQSEGYVHIESVVGSGTRVLVYLKRVHGAADSPSNVSPRALPRGGSETVLLVEDEESVRRLAVLLLKRSGYRVLVAASAEDALDLSRGFEDEIHLLLTDVVLPGMNGRKLADILAAERPKMLVVFASGYFDERGILGPRSEFIQKPFNPDTLARTVRRVLDRGPRETA